MPEWFYINKYNLCANFAINSQRVLVFYVSYTFIKVTLLSGGGIGNFIRSLYTYGTINIVRLYKQRTVIFFNRNTIVESIVRFCADSWR